MIPLKKADKNAKAPEREVKPPAWKSKPKPQPHKNVNYPTNYAGKAADTPAHDLDSLLPPVKAVLKSSIKGKEGERSVSSLIDCNSLILGNLQSS